MKTDLAIDSSRNKMDGQPGMDHCYLYSLIYNSSGIALHTRIRNTADDDDDYDDHHGDLISQLASHW